jgi:Cu+-exporting ATPase
MFVARQPPPTRTDLLMRSVLQHQSPTGTLAVGRGMAPSIPVVDRATPPQKPDSACHHCGEPCASGNHEAEGHSFCCLGCQTVFGLLRESGLSDFYSIAARPGKRVDVSSQPDRWAYLDEPSVAAKLLDYSDDRIARVTFQTPAIHCVACVWLLENLFRLHPGIGRSRVNFARREVSITFTPQRAKLSELADLLSRIGYEPSLTLAELDRETAAPRSRLGLQVGVAGFAFGNIMLFSLPLYLGLDSATGPMFRSLFGWLSLALALPVVTFSASDYWRSAWASLRQRTLTLDVPIAAGLAALYGQSAWEILSGHGEGYLDSLAGLVFFLLCGRAFQRKTHERLVFDRDYKGFFPLGVVRHAASGEETVSISQLQVGDRLRVRHGELVPADARLLSGEGLIDYSFVTGESEPVSRQPGDHLYAGGRQVGGAIELETVKPVSQSYLTSLWNDEAFRKGRDDTFNTLTNSYSRRFTRLVLVVAVAAVLGWVAVGNAARGLKAFTSVLIVACPCALALAAPFTLGTAQRLLARRGVCLRNGQVVESIAKVDAIALDKTGTLTAAHTTEIRFHGDTLSTHETAAIAALCRQSAHPYSRRLAQLAPAGLTPEVTEFSETTGAGLSGKVNGQPMLLGSPAWLSRNGIEIPADSPSTATVLVALEGRFRGAFALDNTLRPEIDQLLRQLGQRFELALISGDNARERSRFACLFGEQANLHFNLSPQDKLGFIRSLQDRRRTVMMVGDGLNDAGALRQGDVGVAVVEGVGKFSPASDVILDSPMVCRLGDIVDFCRRATAIVRISFGISAAYNAVGIAIAAAGILSPLICAILMPLSSATVVLFAVGATTWAGHRHGLHPLSQPTPLPTQSKP